jgi:hypothetical protein
LGISRSVPPPSEQNEICAEDVCNDNIANKRVFAAIFLR